MGRGRSGCQVEGCTADLTSCKAYCQKRRCCERHLQADCFARKGRLGWFRYCQQCGKPQRLDEFEGTRRSCMKSLLRRRENTLPSARRHHQHKQPAAACTPAAASILSQPPPSPTGLTGCPAQQPSSLDASVDAAAILADAWCCFSEQPHSREEQQQLAALEQALSGSASAGLDALPDGPLRELLHTWEPGSPSAADAAAAAADANSSCAPPQPLWGAEPAANLLAGFAATGGSLLQSGSSGSGSTGSWGVQAALSQQGMMASAAAGPVAAALAAAPPAARFEPGALLPAPEGDAQARLLRIQQSLAHICDELAGLEAVVQLAQQSMPSGVMEQPLFHP